jgi:hypothetical protein
MTEHQQRIDCPQHMAALDPNTLHCLGGDRFPARPLRIVGGRHVSR